MSNIFKEVLRDYERDRLAAQKILMARRGLLYERLPRIEEIDKQMANFGLCLAQMVLQRDGDEGRAGELKAQNAALAKEREGLLYENGYDETFFGDIYKCAICEDTGFAGGEHCKCLKQRLISRYFEMSNLSRILEHENFDAFNMNYYSNIIDPNHGRSPRENMEGIWTIALNFTEKFGERFENLFLYGETGLGKTFLSNCIAKELLSKGHTVLYTSATQLFRHVENARFNREAVQKGDAALLSMAYDVDLLIIDDLGTEFATTVTTSELFNFINTRLLTKKSTIISTNLSPGDLEDFYFDRITSRIFGEYTTLQFIGDDIRIAKKQGLV